MTTPRTSTAPQSAAVPTGPIRTCIATRTTATQRQLLRVVVDQDSGRIVPDPTRTLPGRGAWLTPTVDALDTAIKRRAFERALKVPAPADTGRVREYLAHQQPAPRDGQCADTDQGKT